jgi:hypothetical protein
MDATPNEQARLLIDQLLAEVRQLTEIKYEIYLLKFVAGRSILLASPDVKAAAVLEAFSQHVGIAEQQSELRAAPAVFRWNHSAVLQKLIVTLLRDKLPFTRECVERLVGLVVRCGEDFVALIEAGVLQALEDFVARDGMPDSLYPGVELVATRLGKQKRQPEERRLWRRVQALLEQAPLKQAGFALTTDEAWTNRLRAAQEGMDAATRTHWDALLVHAATATTSKPSRKWLQLARPLVDALGPDAFASVLAAVLAELGKRGATPKTWVWGMLMEGDPTTVHDTHSDLLRGLVWCTSLVPQERLIAAVGAAADVCFKKIPGVGPRAPKIGNACVWALSALDDRNAVGQLSRLKTRAKHVSIRKQLDKALDTVAEKQGLTTDELEEIAVPTCGLTAVGTYRVQLGEHWAVLQVNDRLKAEVAWYQPDRTRRASVPATIKQRFPSEVATLKQIEKEVEKLLPVQRDRLEQLFAQERSWTLPEFRARFLDHLLVGALARRLIWRFTDGPRVGAGIWHDEHIRDENGRELDWLSETTRVCLWHPLHAEPAQVQAWRDWLEAHTVRQPFKQAHREIYLLTDAERQTGAYSNRFAAHILRQHQFAALCQQRGWRYLLQGDWDSANTPTFLLPRWDLRAEFWVQPVRQDGDFMERGDLAHSGMFLYVATDQVRFYRLQEPVPLPLVEVPPLAFSEVMRAVDLFIGVASVGNDPNWADSGLLGATRGYWERYSFGELFPSAQTRKAVLERLVPRLKIAERCSFSERFLIVRGDLRTYKIHLGSGNILMAPNDQYLCIVPKQGAAATDSGKVYLPFDGDSMLSLILSKALLLADDQKIKDPTIRNQIVASSPIPVT